jgi:hypothetical protein
VFTLPADVDQRSVVTDGAGTLGRQIASVYDAAGGEQGDRTAGEGNAGRRENQRENDRVR